MKWATIFWTLDIKFWLATICVSCKVWCCECCNISKVCVTSSNTHFIIITISAIIPNCCDCCATSKCIVSNWSDALVKWNHSCVCAAFKSICTNCTNIWAQIDEVNYASISCWTVCKSTFTNSSNWIWNIDIFKFHAAFESIVANCRAIACFKECQEFCIAAASKCFSADYNNTCRNNDTIDACVILECPDTDILKGFRESNCCWTKIFWNSVVANITNINPTINLIIKICRNVKKVIFIRFIDSCKWIVTHCTYIIKFHFVYIAVNMRSSCWRICFKSVVSIFNNAIVVAIIYSSNKCSPVS